MKLDGPNQLWVADITYVTIATGFVYLAAILDAWSRRVVGYAISRSIDARLAVAALKARHSAPAIHQGVALHHSDRGSQYASEDYRAILQKHGLTGSMGRRGNPYDNAEGQELHEDAQSRSRVSDGIRNLRGRYSRPSPLHRQGLQQPQTPLRARLPTIKGALQIVGQIWKPIDKEGVLTVGPLPKNSPAAFLRARLRCVLLFCMNPVLIPSRAIPTAHSVCSTEQGAGEYHPPAPSCFRYRAGGLRPRPL